MLLHGCFLYLRDINDVKILSVSELHKIITNEPKKFY